MGFFSNFGRRKEKEYTAGLLHKLWEDRLEQLDKKTNEVAVETGIQQESSAETKAKAISAEYGNPAKDVPARMPISRGLSSGEALKQLQKLFGKLAGEMIKEAVGLRSKTKKKAKKLAVASENLIKQGIKNNLSPSLQPETIAKKEAKGYKKPSLPLVAEGIFIKEIKGKVVTK